MDNGADPMIPNIANKETAFHYCGLSGNSEVILFSENISTDYHFTVEVVKEIIKHLHAGQIQLVVNKQSGWVAE